MLLLIQFIHLLLQFQIGNDVSTILQLLYIGISAFVVAGFVEFLDEKDRFFTAKILEITIYEWGLYIGIACLGILKRIVL